tara:strand:+ start:2530 stop:3114 length:585 start_codon:yes stop_codon:yes gene_type:complete
LKKKQRVKKIAIFGSGFGSNAENICLFFANSTDVSVVLIGTNNKNSFLINRAKKLNIPLVLFSKTDLNNFDELHKKLAENEVDCIVLAGFLLKIPAKMINKYSNKIINLHPSLLPKYGGKGMYGENIHREVLRQNEKISGITVHLVNEKYDDGKILFQKKCNVSSTETVASLSKKISELELLFFPKIINDYLLK